MSKLKVIGKKVEKKRTQETGSTKKADRQAIILESTLSSIESAAAS